MKSIIIGMLIILATGTLASMFHPMTARWLIFAWLCILTGIAIAASAFL